MMKVDYGSWIFFISLTFAIGISWSIVPQLWVLFIFMSLGDICFGAATILDTIEKLRNPKPLRNLNKGGKKE